MDLHEQAMRYLGVTLPVVDTILKSAFRRASRELHPDRGGDEEKFKQMKRAYEDILKAGLTITSDVNQPEGVLRTVEGIPLTELGLGLGPTTNGQDCTVCDGRGYRQFNPDIYGSTCGACRGNGILKPCLDCKGTGLFTLRYGKQVQCRRCKGHGGFVMEWLFYGRSVNCKGCNGTGRTIRGKAVQYAKCSTCDGKGEIKIYNPVLLKGGIVTHMSQSERKRLAQELE